MGRGITPVIAVILLLLITIAIIGVAFTFFQRTTQSATTAGQTQLAAQINQTQVNFKIESVDKNQVYIRNLGTNTITALSLAFYVNDQQIEFAGPVSLAQNSVGTYFLNDSKLTMLPDPATLKVTGGIVSDIISTCFYCNYYAGYWKFDENSGTIAADFGRNGNDVTLTNGASWTTGKYGSALNLNGANQYARRASGIKMPLGSSPRTFMAWISPTGYVDTNYNGIVAYNMNCVSQGSLLSIQNNGRLSMAFWCNDAFQTVGTAATLNNWNHVAFTYDGGTTIKFYINGELVQQTNTASSGATVDGPIRIGCTDDPGRCFTGQIDEVRVFNFVRSMTTA